MRESKCSRIKTKKNIYVERKTEMISIARRSTEDQLFDNLTDTWLTSRDAAAFLKVSLSSLMNMCSNGQIPYYKLERRNRYRLSDLEDLLLKTKKGGY